MATTQDNGPFGPLIETRLRVLSWNIWGRFGPWEARQPAIAATLAALDADVICLQEVWALGERRQHDLLADPLGFDAAFASRIDLDGEQFGNAVLSRWPIKSREVLALPAPADQDELRTVIRADIDGPRGPLQIYCTHLNWRFDQSAVRQTQVGALCEFVAAAPPRSYPVVVCGDFNAPPDSDEIRALTGRAAVPAPKLVFHDAFEVAGTGDGFTWSNTNPHASRDLEPDRRIDYVFAGWPRAGGAGHVVRADVVCTAAVDGMVPSDHYGVLAELRY